MPQNKFDKKDKLKGNRQAVSPVVARLTVTRKNGWKTIVEIPADATLSSFYKYYRQFGAKRSTKEPIRTAGRSEGCPGFFKGVQKPGLDLILKRLETYQGESNPIISHRTRIIKKRAYRKLLNARPDELGMVKSRVNLTMERWRSERAIPVPVRIPVSASVLDAV